MKSQFNSQQAAKFAGDDLAMRVYTSRLLGAEEDLVMHGGGNTSIKSTVQDFFGRPVDVLFVKGSGWDLKTIEKPGFSPLRLKETQMLAHRESLSDDDMAQQLRALLLDQSAPAPSVEAILHALIPYKVVDHTHADAVVTLTNNPRGEEIISQLYPDCLVLPYVMPGFILAKQVYDAIQIHDLSQFKGIILMHHGVFTFADDVQVAYENMIALVDRAQQHIGEKVSADGFANFDPSAPGCDLLRLCSIRRSVSKARGAAQLAVLDDSLAAAGFASLANVDDLATRGPITPDHVIHTKRTACIFGQPSPPPAAAGDQPWPDEVTPFAQDYLAYFQRHSREDMTMLDPAPRWGVWKNVGTLAFGSSFKDCKIISDLNRHTAACIQTGEAIGGWEALPAKDIFDLEYWVLEQIKLAKAGVPKVHQGKIAIVTGAASGIGLATAQQLHEDGCAVVGLDINPTVADVLDSDSLIGRVCDVTCEEAVQSEVNRVVKQFGGLDVLVLNAGVFESGETIDALDQSWSRAIEINLTATQRVLRHCIPFLKLGCDASVVIVGSRNFSAPGAGAAAYSVSKAGVTQLGRVAALELAADQVRVNTVHPDAVFDTGVWSAEALEKSAARYDMTVDQYKSKNLLSREIKSTDVAALISTVAGPVFNATTGAQIPIDGGNDRVI
jgi:rhamnose utilization protein RhaD (predicted bifunctional aldolase and dehydrogenase)/NAD(P)-dependent dehydrogenase (short-subunit alcohol dehydrogenase family)